ncbi:hypothetical protein [Albimonas pacifica]|uniref:NfeD-like C-terminal, partner-binding n=1 Tax=Albimonas pacifica TaxID=1114924 RepID=A0A1I3D484_9RHOB|nr:hypothetical protein [Albimonas pacifica]SFH81532.1 hypothetical protein SAMN05216258_102378 [Albimonas pacifica]
MLAAWLSDPWIWLGLGLALLLAELVVSGYVLLSFSFGAFAMALALLVWRIGLGLVLPDPAGTGGLLALLVAWMLFSGLSLALIWRFWRGRSRGPKGEDDDVNEFRNRL